jgi:uncharacterized protein (TIGR03118 family)
MRLFRSSTIAGGLLLFLSLMSGADAGPAPVTTGNAYDQHNLVSNGDFEADHTDPLLVNPWGIAFNPAGNVWVADNGKGVATLYDGNGSPNPALPSVTIPAPGGGQSRPTGIVFNVTGAFLLPNSSKAIFLFATEDGTIAGWNGGTQAVQVVPPAATPAIYKGIAITGNGTQARLYATDFHNGKVDVFGPDFQPVTLPNGFVDPRLPHGFAPFGIQNIKGNLYVTYAKQDAEKEDDVAGRGLGAIDVFDPDGKLIRRFASGVPLDAPWGIAEAPDNFGKFSNRLLVGNFGDGRINAFDLDTGNSVGVLRTPDRRPLEIEGLWGLAFGNGALNQPVNTLFFAAGPNDESSGIYGRITAVAGGGDD